MANQFDRIVSGVAAIRSLRESVEQLVRNISGEVRMITSPHAAHAFATLLETRAGDIATHVTRNAVIEAYALPAEPAEH
jgi:hypothetical protein